MYVRSCDRRSDLPSPYIVFIVCVFSYISFLTNRVQFHWVSFVVKLNFSARWYKLPIVCRKIIHEDSRICDGKVVTCIAEYGNFLPGPDSWQRLLVFYSFASLSLFSCTIHCSYLIWCETETEKERIIQSKRKKKRGNKKERE